MVNANRCLFRCIGCKTKATEESEFININESPRHTKVIHINDLIVSKPQLVADTPKSLYFTRPSAERQSSSLGSVKEPIAIPIRYGWPSDLSFEQVSTLRKKDDEIHDKEFVYS
ncbi:hypothetical protein BEWA_034550 [Theileria equi strain WA]|uniref:Uncharacterized protein n=1 Tax=Theileria equi strain WA TaxID=1537102 RepID=L0AYC8_THEEQ|nr:hypothetical protein BEWA_034550 [Theileria equi strain WA]AFZ80597.1 hypothetical protein BEWA_034550 [Theileria equi strain WA]|eukprot:XP_004830263.1 hypothetical protein BEWA_034550 [Theileria equi strain WA]